MTIRNQMRNCYQGGRPPDLRFGPRAVLLRALPVLVQRFHNRVERDYSASLPFSVRNRNVRIENGGPSAPPRRGGMRTESAE